MIDDDKFNDNWCISDGLWLIKDRILSDYWLLINDWWWFVDW